MAMSLTLDTEEDVYRYQKALGLADSVADIVVEQSMEEIRFLNTKTGELFVPGDLVVLSVGPSKKLPGLFDKL